MPELDQKLLQELLNTFRDEAVEHLDTMNHALLQFERTPDGEDRQRYIQDAFRAAHSLKGAARAVSLDDIESVAHSVETAFQAVRDEGMLLGADDCDLLYESIDHIQQILSGNAVDTSNLLERLQAITQNGHHESNGLVEPQAGPETFQIEADETIRVSLRKLDDLMVELGELLVSRISTTQRMNETREINKRLQEWKKSWETIKVSMKQRADAQLQAAIQHHSDIIQGILEDFAELEQSTRRDVTRLEMVTGNLQDKVRRVRMIPFSTHALLLERVVRDAARTEGKEVAFTIIGSATELDKRVLETLKDPLVHLLRNAVGHGIERPDERGDKPEEGSITLTVEQRGSEVHLHVQDDGRGFQVDKLRDAYEKRYGETIENPVNLAFLPGVTTSSDINEIAGRGIGLDVVREHLEQVHGRFSVQTEPGQGTTITLIVPTSLAITRVLMVAEERQQYAIPLMSIEKILVPDQIVTVSGKPMLRTEDGNIPLATLANLLSLSDTPGQRQHLALIVVTGDQRLAVLVDDVLTEQELAVKPIGFPLMRVANVTGAALTGSGNPVIVLNPADFIHTYRGTTISMPGSMRKTESDETPLVRVLVVDDSITTRTLERNILEAAGYTVTTATDGTEALNQLQTFEVDVVVSDIEMPNMNGFDLTRAVRDDDRLSHLPIILVTSLESEQDREHGMRAGANAYVVKRGFNQSELLSIIEQLT